MPSEVLQIAVIVGTLGLPIVECLTALQVHLEADFERFEVAVLIFQAVGVDKTSAKVVNRACLGVGRVIEVELGVDGETSHRVRLHVTVLDADPGVAR